MAKEPKTVDELYSIMKSKTVKVISNFTSYYDICELQCQTCNHTWKDRPIKILNHSLCPLCREKSMASPYGDKDNKVFNKSRMFKLWQIKYKGSVCKGCGVDLTDAPWLADFHHRESKDKDFEIGIITIYPTSMILKELNKCDLLCSNCHRAVHADIDKYNKNKDHILKLADDLLKKYPPPIA